MNQKNLLAGKKILIVDDEAPILKALSRELHFFMKEKEMTLITSQSPVEAIELVKEDANDIVMIISDQKMPEMNGSDLLAEIKQIRSDLIFIILTGYADIEEVIKSIKVGIISYILKPWQKEHLLGEITKGLELFVLRKQNIENQKRLTEELKWAGELQNKLLKIEIPQSEQVKFQVSYLPQPDLQCGGDYYDVFKMKNEKYLVILGDVTGHGVKAAFLTVFLKSIIFQEYIKFHLHDLELDNFLYWLNNRVCDLLRNVSDMMIPFSALIVDVVHKQLDYCCAGDIPIYHLRNQEVNPLMTEGVPLGFQKKSYYQKSQINITNLDRIIIFTDGLFEKSKPDQGTLTKDFYKLLTICHNLTSDFNQTLIKQVKEKLGIEKFSDDATLISINLNNLIGQSL
ncbi:MAG: fused response regulator/phosphatase [Spirochaetes bacterium]|nr:fused response regulator/phosphatase [Spirochaetota bacterium]